MTVSIIRDALPIEQAERARAMFLEMDFTHAPFQDAAHFARQFPDGGPGIPDADELYPKVEQETGRACRSCVLKLYKMPAGAHLRLHRDNPLGHTGFVWHLSKGWKWDWGGLMVALDGEQASATLPAFNALVLIDHAAAVPHLVTQVAPWAKEPRMVVTGILR